MMQLIRCLVRALAHTVECNCRLCGILRFCCTTTSSAVMWQCCTGVVSRQLCNHPITIPRPQCVGLLHVPAGPATSCGFFQPAAASFHRHRSQGKNPSCRIGKLASSHSTGQLPQACQMQSLQLSCSVLTHATGHIEAIIVNTFGQHAG